MAKVSNIETKKSGEAGGAGGGGDVKGKGEGTKNSPLIVGQPDKLELLEGVKVVGLKDGPKQAKVLDTSAAAVNHVGAGAAVVDAKKVAATTQVAKAPVEASKPPPKGAKRKSEYAAE